MQNENNDFDYFSWKLHIKIKLSKGVFKVKHMIIKTLLKLTKMKIKMSVENLSRFKSTNNYAGHMF